MAKVSRTLNPLHFEDLEPHRFEDIVRQLIYDFKSWRRLEPTGRGGGDDGFDVRGLEAATPDEAPARATDGDIEDDGADEPGQSDRLWLVQCKREKAISPKKLLDYLEAIPAETVEGLYGVIFAAACDFSKKARDAFFQWARENSVAEAHLWGKADLEDQLYQPKNDNLLFAYFGFSLQIRKRSIRTALRSRLAMKKRAETVFGKVHHSCVLLRDPTDDDYPYTNDRSENHQGKWRVVPFRGLGPLGLLIQAKRHFAYIDDKTEGWDIIEAVDVGKPSRHEDHWAEPEEPAVSNLHARALHVWSALPDMNRANYYEEMLIRYEDILAIDEAGDELASFPHVYIELDTELPQRKIMEPLQRYFGRGSFGPDPKDRLKFFPDPLPPLPARVDTPNDTVRGDEDERLGRDP